MLSKAQQAVLLLGVPSAAEGAVIAQIWNTLRLQAYYSADGCRFCHIPSSNGKHLPGCNVPLLRATEELVLLRITRWFAMRGIDPNSELPLVSAMFAEQSEGMFE